VGALGFHAKALLLLKPDVILGLTNCDRVNSIGTILSKLQGATEVPSVRFRLARVARSSSRSFLLRRFTLDRTGSSAALIVAGLALVKFGDAG
jgi:hypothetical protein